MPTSVRSFAERLLLGPSLADKLFDPGPGALADEQRGVAWRGAAQPGREGALCMAAQAEPFVRDAALADPRSRGRALHFFANHELLALELMALALLRFVDAPAPFRRGLVSTIRDEQRHLSLYLGRMRALGVELGDAPLGGFFWRTVSELEDPAAFVAHMSLTFEQANLDYALHYERAFRALGDEASAALMAEVYADEISHVGFGLHWFQRWRPAPLWEAHGEALVAPVTLRRARGRGFDRRGRERAGFPADYVEAIANLPSARGRRPVVHLFEPYMEFELGNPGSFNPSAAMRARTRDLECLPAFYAPPDDVVLVRELPRPDFLASLRAAGVALPEFRVGQLDAPLIRAPGLDEIARVEPWGWTPRLAARLAKLRRAARHPRVPERGWPREVSSKVQALEVLGGLLHVNSEHERDPQRLSAPTTLGLLVHDPSEIDGALAELRGRGFETLVCKAPFGASGRGLQRVMAGPVPQAQRAWFERILAQQGALVVEPWLDRVCDLSLRLRIDQPGQAEIESIGRELIDARGQFRGALIGKPSTGLSPDLARFFHGEGRDPKWMARTWRRTAAAVAEQLAPTGYVGLIGVDAFIHRAVEGEGLRLRPVVELNTRMHMSHIAQELGPLLAPRRVGVWRFVPRAGLRLPLEPLERGPKGLLGGVLATNDPDRAELVVGLLAVAPSITQAEAMLDRHGPSESSP